MQGLREAVASNGEGIAPPMGGAARSESKNFISTDDICWVSFWTDLASKLPVLYYPLL
jgi:hypothetical protein